MTKILKELTEQLENLEELIDATNYKDDDGGTITAAGGRSK